MDSSLARRREECRRIASEARRVVNEQRRRERTVAAVAPPAFAYAYLNHLMVGVES